MVGDEAEKDCSGHWEKGQTHQGGWHGRVKLLGEEKEGQKGSPGRCRHRHQELARGGNGGRPHARVHLMGK
jgi:hypothetical protein